MSGIGAAPSRFGILIYTATAGAQGTLGGLVGTVPRFAHILRRALERAAICSNDPVCADHEPDDRSGDRATHGAACHGCLLIAETSCEMRNLFLVALHFLTSARVASALQRNPPGFVVRTEAQKAAWDNRYRLERGTQGGWLRYASTTAPGRHLDRRSRSTWTVALVDRAPRRRCGA